MLFVTCLVDQFAPGVGESVVNVLERLGLEVVFPAGQTCCGQPAFNSGFRSDARPVAKRFIEVFKGPDLIVTPSGSCASMVRNFYPELFHEDPAWLERARETASRTWEFTEFIVDVMKRPDLGGELAESATYHQCCHLMRELGVDRQPRALLKGIRGLDLKPLERSEVCCGFGGTFAVKMSEISSGILKEKLDNVEKSGAGMLVAGDTGCIMHMQGGLRRRGRGDVRVMHIAELLDEATG